MWSRVSFINKNAEIDLDIEQDTTTVISGFRRDIDEICDLLGYYAASCGNCLPTFRDVSATQRRVITQKTTDFSLRTVTLWS